MSTELERKVIEGFGDEWSRYPQSILTAEEQERLFNKYFYFFPWEKLPEEGGVGIDVGCGSGRYAKMVAPKVKKLHLLDASEKALAVAKSNLDGHENVEFHLGSAYELPLADDSLDFAYSLGVLHHIENIEPAVEEVVRVVAKGGIVLVYLYYDFENRPFWFKWIWRLSNGIRRVISRFSYPVRDFICQMIAILIYWPAAKTAKLLEKFSCMPTNFPLSYYRNSSLYHMKTCALDRFGTRLEHRFSRTEIKNILEKAGLRDIVFSDKEPFWCAYGFKA